MFLTIITAERDGYYGNGTVIFRAMPSSYAGIVQVVWFTAIIHRRNSNPWEFERRRPKLAARPTDARRVRILGHPWQRETMAVWRAFFFAIGAMLVIVGVECLLIDSATFASEAPQTAQVSNSWFQPVQPLQAATKSTIRPPEWIPWSLIASGAVVVLYALTLPKRFGTAAA